MNISQELRLAVIGKHADFIIVPSDNNLGPCIMERAKYIEHTFVDHLSHKEVYCRLGPGEIDCLDAKVRTLLYIAVQRGRLAKVISDYDNTYFSRVLQQ